MDMERKMTGQKECRRICRQSRSNFTYTFYFLQKEKRYALEAFYAFCRLVDDVVDEAISPEKAREGISYWRTQLSKMYEGEPDHIVAQVLRVYLKKFNVPREYLEEILAGCEMDLNRREYATFSDLDLYMYRVASCVGLVSIYFFGIPPTLENCETAVSLGKALQMTNILRDIRSDLIRGRIYLPMDDMEKCGVHPTDLARISSQSELGLLDLLHLEMRRARRYFDEAVRGLPEDKRSLRLWLAPILMGRVYEKILDPMERRPLRVFEEKITLSLIQKLQIIAKTGRELYFV